MLHSTDPNKGIFLSEQTESDTEPAKLIFISELY